MRIHNEPRRKCIRCGLISKSVKKVTKKILPPKGGLLCNHCRLVLLVDSVRK